MHSAKGDARLGISSEVRRNRGGAGQLVIAGGIPGRWLSSLGLRLQEITSCSSICRSVAFAMRPTSASISELIEIAFGAHMPRKQRTGAITDACRLCHSSTRAVDVRAQTGWCHRFELGPRYPCCHPLTSL